MYILNIQKNNKLLKLLYYHNLKYLLIYDYLYVLTFNEENYFEIFFLILLLLNKKN